MLRSWKFWVLFTSYVREQLESDMDARERVRRQVIEMFFDGDAGGKTEVKRWLDDLLYLPSDTNTDVVRQEVRQGMEEMQNEEEIVFVGWGKKECLEVTMADLNSVKEDSPAQKNTEPDDKELKLSFDKQSDANEEKQEDTAAQEQELLNEQLDV